MMYLVKLTWYNEVDDHTCHFKLIMAGKDASEVAQNVTKHFPDWYALTILPTHEEFLEISSEAFNEIKNEYMELDDQWE